MINSKQTNIYIFIWNSVDDGNRLTNGAQFCKKKQKSNAISVTKKHKGRVEWIFERRRLNAHWVPSSRQTWFMFLLRLKTLKDHLSRNSNDPIMAVRVCSLIVNVSNICNFRVDPQILFKSDIFFSVMILLADKKMSELNKFEDLCGNCWNLLSANICTLIGPGLNWTCIKDF